MLLADYHCHTNYSNDSKASMKQMIEGAIAKGLKEIVLTDHVDYLADGSEFPYQIDYDKYIQELEEMRAHYKNIRITLGVETGLGPHLVKHFETFLKKYPFEFIIGSSHDISGVDLYKGGFFVNKSKTQAFTEYFNEVLFNINNFKDFCVYGHLDYIVRYSEYEDNSLNYADFSDIIDEVLKALVKNGKGLELNTSGYRYGLNQVHPKYEILRRFKELGGEIITIGSDAHRPEHISQNFKEAYELANAAGFNYTCVFRNRKPEYVKL